jgi:hypothetical protein
MDLRSVLVAVMPTAKGTQIQSRTERLDLVEGKGTLTLEEGPYDLWVGARLSPDSGSHRIVPDMVSVEVRADRPASVRSALTMGGVARVPPGMGLPPASAGRLTVQCYQGTTTVRRWVALRPSDASHDMIWPPLPKGDWALHVQKKDGTETKFGIWIDGRADSDVVAVRAGEWRLIREEMSDVAEDMEFLQGLVALLVCEDEETREWARLVSGQWLPVVRRMTGKDEDPLAKPVGDPAWKIIKDSARRLGLEREVEENPSGGPLLAAAIRRKCNLGCWSAGTADFDSVLEIPLDEFEAGLRVKVQLGPLDDHRGALDARGGPPLDHVSVKVAVLNASGAELASRVDDGMPLPGSQLLECKVTGEGRECVRLWFRRIPGPRLRWWANPSRIPKDVK